MGRNGELERIKRARKPRLCDWCRTAIDIGEPYTRWRYFEDGEPPMLVRMHPECLEAAADGDDDEFYPGAHPRGGKCGWCGECEHCRKTRKENTDE